MTESTNIKGKVLVVAMVLVAFAAALAIVATTGNPAEAATGTTCSASSKAPFAQNTSTGRYVYFRTSVNCSAPIETIGIRAHGYQYYSGAWHKVAYASAPVNGRSSATLTAVVKCDGEQKPYSFRTKSGMEPPKEHPSS